MIFVLEHTAVSMTLWLNVLSSGSTHWIFQAGELQLFTFLALFLILILFLLGFFFFFAVELHNCSIKKKNNNNKKHLDCKSRKSMVLYSMRNK